MKKTLFFIMILVLSAGVPLLLQGADLNHNQYPKLANLFFRWDITESEARELAKWDVLVVDMEVQTYSPESLELIKKINPDVKLLAYIASQEIRGDSGELSGTLRQKLYNKISNQWWLKNTSGQKVYWWPGNHMINLTAEAPKISGQSWTTVLPSFVKTELIDAGYWDGVFYDNVWDNLNFMSGKQIDLNQDGNNESMTEINQKWESGMQELLQNTRNLLGPDKFILGNGGEKFYSLMNGSLYEHFPKKGWGEMMEKYRFMNSHGYQPALGILNSNVDNTGNKENYQKMRFGLTSALLDDGYYSFDNGDQTHREIWWYDEYEAYLGEPAGRAFEVFGNNNDFKQGVWRRDFKNGLVIVNSTNQAKKVDLGGEYEKLHGTQDPYVNNGFFVEEVNLPAKDGLILLRPVDDIYQATYINGSFARVFNGFGNVARTGFFAYKEEYKGGSQVIEYNLLGDEKKEILVAGDSLVEIFNSQGELLHEFYPYTKNYNKGINITVGDLDNNNTLEIVTGTENGGGPHIRVFNNKGKLINPGFFAYGPEFRGGVNVTIADLEGDGWYEIIAGAGYGGGPHVRVFGLDGRCINPGFFAYDPGFRGGVNVAAGDIDGDGVDEIITGPGKGGAPQIKVFDKNGQISGPTFYAFDKKTQAGAEVAASDMDGDGKSEIIATTADVFTLAGFE
ncbi:MAG TPA: putative glycoside hydrolase [Patescibacteria group bacterium]|nr:putative glycoside hydrolase [Patescibacteria group bacterium]